MAVRIRRYAAVATAAVAAVTVFAAGCGASAGHDKRMCPCPAITAVRTRCPPRHGTGKSRCVRRTNRAVCSSLPGGRMTPGRVDHSTGEGCDGDTFTAVHAVCAMGTATTSPPCRFEGHEGCVGYEAPGCRP